MTRIVAGAARGRRLIVPGTGTRPTSDRAREAVFSSIESIRGPWHGSRVLDLYAGSGAFGLEARSRGAHRVDLVERDRAAVAAITSNVATVGDSTDPDTNTEEPLRQESSRQNAVRVHRSDVRQWVERQVHPTGEAYDVVFCDPPYATESTEVMQVLTGLGRAELVGDGSLVVVERAARDAPWMWPTGMQGTWDRRYGEAHLWIGEVRGRP